MIDRGTRVWRKDGVAAGGSPWRLVRARGRALGMLNELLAVGAAGVEFTDPGDLALARVLTDRGLVHPVPILDRGARSVTVVVPAYGRPESLARCLSALAGEQVIVVDDATPAPDQLAAVCSKNGADYVRLVANSGPGAARNFGARKSNSEFIAFVDSDVVVEPGWLDALLAHFDDYRVAAVAPRIRANDDAHSLLSRYETVGSALDMGPDPALVRPGARIGYVPSAVLAVRREEFLRHRFDEQLRVGEDVDLVWRLVAAGRQVRYEPRSVVRHEVRGSLHEWARRRMDYGTSAAELDRRHPEFLAPVRISALKLVAAGLVAARRPVLAGAAVVAIGGPQARELMRRNVPPLVAVNVIGSGAWSDAVAIGHALRREYWPLGVVAAVASRRSSVARMAVATMVIPVASDAFRARQRIDPALYAALRVTADAAYGLGVLRGCVARRSALPLLPRLRPRAARPGT